MISDCKASRRHRLNLPIDADRLAQQDQILSLSGMTWEDYEKLTDERNSYHLSYFNGVITIVRI